MYIQLKFPREETCVYIGVYEYGKESCENCMTKQNLTLPIVSSNRHSHIEHSAVSKKRYHPQNTTPSRKEHHNSCQRTNCFKSTCPSHTAGLQTPTTIRTQQGRSGPEVAASVFYSAIHQICHLKGQQSTVSPHPRPERK